MHTTPGRCKSNSKMPKKASKSKSAAAERAAERSAERAREAESRRAAEEARAREEEERGREEEAEGDEDDEESVGGAVAAAVGEEEEEETTEQKLCCSFSPAKEEKLVEFFSTHDCFYNKGSSNYHKQNFKDKLLEGLARDLHTTSKYPIFHLCVCYCVHLKSAMFASWDVSLLCRPGWISGCKLLHLKLACSAPT